jgi:polyisoprenoid-binding protein YceI
MWHAYFRPIEVQMQSTIRVAAILLAWGTPLAAQAVPDMVLTSGEVAFDGSGSLGGFTGTTTSVRGRLAGGTGLEMVRGWVEADAATLDTGNGRRDKDMRSSLAVERFPVIRFDLAAVGAGEAMGDSIPVTLRGTFTIHGVRREQAVTGWVWRTADEVRFRGRTPMNLKDYQIGGLSKLFGVLKMNEEIVVRMDVTFGTMWRSHRIAVPPGHDRPERAVAPTPSNSALSRTVSVS